MEKLEKTFDLENYKIIKIKNKNVHYVENIRVVFTIN